VPSITSVGEGGNPFISMLDYVDHERFIVLKDDVITFGNDVVATSSA